MLYLLLGVALLLVFQRTFVSAGTVKVCAFPGSCVLTPDCEKFSFSFGDCETSADILEFCEGGDVSRRRGVVSYASARSSCNEEELTLDCYTTTNCTGTVYETEFPTECDSDTMSFFSFTCSSNSNSAGSLSASFVATISLSVIVVAIGNLL